MQLSSVEAGSRAADAPTPSPGAPPFIALLNVSLVYGEDDGVLAVDGLNLSVGKGQFAAVVGPSGCGKSTLMKLVSGLLPPTGGEVRVDGQRVTRPIRGVGMAFQNPLLMPWRTTLENVLLPLEVAPQISGLYKRSRETYVRKARDLLDSVGLAGFANKFPWELSGGMQQRASLCRAIIHQPDILILDEPFAALDSFTREELWQAMQTLWMEQKFTAILVTHDLREAIYLADVVNVMSGRPGKIIKEQAVAFTRPRPLTVSSSAAFNEVVDDLRADIMKARGA